MYWWQWMHCLLLANSDSKCLFLCFTIVNLRFAFNDFTEIISFLHRPFYISHAFYEFVFFLFCCRRWTTRLISRHVVSRHSQTFVGRKWSTITPVKSNPKRGVRQYHWSSNYHRSVEFMCLRFISLTVRLNSVSLML